jgi:leucyl/phenylalanyl-tRNA--protein transferase
MQDRRDDEPVFFLREGDALPAPELSRGDGLLAVGGRLTVARLLEAYRQGVFPWYEAGGPVLWWSPDPRLVLDPGALSISRSLRATIRKSAFTTTLDTAFRRVVHSCAATPRKDGPGSWITPDVEAAYTALHLLGHAHSVETWQQDELVGGLYGVLLGRCFFGESMFATRPDASKVALVRLAGELIRRGVNLIDCQVATAHLASLGAIEIPRAEFLERLREGLKQPELCGMWVG